MSPAQIVAVALLPIGGSLFGVWVGWRLGMAERIQQWRRDKQIDAYSELVAAGAVVATAAYHELTADTNDEHAAAGRESAEAQLRFHDAFHRAVIVASPTVRTVVDELGDMTTEAVRELHKVDRDDTAISDRLTQASHIRRTLSETARNDLGFGAANLKPTRPLGK